MKVNLLVIATNKYTTFLKGLLDSANDLFLKDHDVFFNVFTDRIEEAKTILNGTPYYDKTRFLSVTHKPFPYTTLYRFHFFEQHKDTICDADQYFYIDVDCIIKKKIGNEILGRRTAVQHCGFVRERGSYETNPASTSYVPDNIGTIYYGGGFWGFCKEEFWSFTDKAKSMIDEDEKNNIIPVWHDESVLNKYLTINEPDVVLSPAYHYPESNHHIYSKWNRVGVSYECTILLLDKNHEYIRS